MKYRIVSANDEKYFIYDNIGYTLNPSSSTRVCGLISKLACYKLIKNMCEKRAE